MAATIDLTTPHEPARRRPWWSHLYVQVLTAILGGVLIGHYFPDFGVLLKPFGDSTTLNPPCTIRLHPPLPLSALVAIRIFRFGFASCA